MTAALYAALSKSLSLLYLSVQFASCSCLLKVSVDLTIRAVLDVPSESQTSIRPSHHCSENGGSLAALLSDVWSWSLCTGILSLSLSLSLSNWCKAWQCAKGRLQYAFIK
jgi:hypothetical protein